MKTFLAALAASAISTSVYAADAFVPQQPQADWTGLYLGGYIGAGGIVNNIEIPAAGPGNFNGIGGEGFLGGLMIGYNYQFSPVWVAGIQAEVGLSNLTTELNVPGLGFALDAKPEWTASLSGRLGWLPTPDTMLYVIGGYSFADYDVDITLGAAAVNFNQNYHGFHLGTGIETHVSDRLTARVEYRYTQYGGEAWGLPGILNVEPSSHTGTIALAYNFHDRGLSGAASAYSPSSWSQFYAGAFVGAGAIVNNIEIPPAGPGNFNGIGGEGVLGGVLIGYDHQFGSNWVAGIQAEVAITNLSTELNIPGAGFAIDAQPDWTAAISGRLGWLATPSSMLYVIGGYSHADYDVDITLGPVAVSFSQDYNGFHAGTGIETFVTENLTARVEYRYTHYSGEDWGTAGILDVEPSSHTGRAALVWRFGGD